LTAALYVSMTQEYPRLVTPQHCHPHSSSVCKTKRSYIGLDKKAGRNFRYSASLSSLVISSRAHVELRNVNYVIFFYGKVQSSPHIVPISLKHVVHYLLN